MEHFIETAQKVLQAAERNLPDSTSLPFGIDVSTKSVMLTLVTLGPIAYAIAKYYIYRLYFHPLRKIPGPRTGWIPLLGNMPEVVSGESCDTYKDWAAKYGGLVCFSGPLNTPRLMVSDPQLLKLVLNTQHYDFAKSPTGAAIIKTILGEGLFAAEGELHRQQRKMLTPSFSVKVLRELTPLLFVPVVQLVDKWTKEINAKQTTEDEAVEIVVSDEVSCVTMDVIGLTGFGQQFNVVRHHGTDEKVNKISWGYEIIFDPNWRSVMGLLCIAFPVLRWLPTEHNRRTEKAMRAIHEESKVVVDRCIERAKDKKNFSENHLLASMIRLSDNEDGNGFTAEEMRVQSLSFLAAGHESAATSLSWCLWLLTQHQDIQDALRAEITPIFEKVNMDHPVFHDNPFETGFDGANLPSHTEINSLHLLDNVTRESARLIPTVPYTVRVTVNDVVLRDHHIPKGTHIYMPLVVNHHDKKVWGEDAEEFRPSRWDEEPGSNAGPYDFMPFLAGGRQCIGFRFATMEIKIILAYLVTKFQFFDKPGFHFKKQSDLTLRPTPNMTLLVKPVSPQKQ